jgi:hypothetical protein
MIPKKTGPRESLTRSPEEEEAALAVQHTFFSGTNLEILSFNETEPHLKFC